MNFDLAQPSILIVTILKYLGLWRIDNKWQVIYRAYSYVLHFCFTILTIASMWASVVTATDFKKFNESLYMSLTEAALLPKVINIFNMSQEAVHFFEFVKREDLSLKNSEEMNIFQCAHGVFYTVERFYFVACLMAILATFAFVSIGQKWILPYPAWMPFEIQSEYYWFAYGFQLIGMIVTCLSNAALDMVLCYFLHHISLIYQVIGYRLENIGFGLDAVSDSVQVNTLVLRDLTEIVKVHGLVIRITTKCERFMSFPLFMQIFLSALVLCFTGYQLKSTSPLADPVHFVEMLDYLLVMGLQIFLPCYYANQITIQSGKLSESLYSSNWIVLPQKSKKMICLYMEFLNKPVYVKVGKFLNIGLPIFSKTINNAYSCFAVLMRMQD